MRRRTRVLLFLSLVLFVPRVAAAESISPGETKLGLFLAANGWSETYTFEAIAGDRVVVTTATRSGSSVQPQIYLRDPADLVEASDTGNRSWFRLDHPLASSGTYTVEVKDYGSGSDGFYSVALVLIPADGSPAADPEGGAISSGETRGGTISLEADTDAYAFYGEAGDRVIITVSLLAYSVQPDLYLYPPGGGAAEATAEGAFNEHRLEHVLEASGIYTILVGDYLQNGVGNYAVALAVIGGAASSPTDPDGGDLVSGETAYGALSGRADTDLYRFEGLAGETVVITADRYGSSSVQPDLYLFPPGGGEAEAQAGGTVLPNVINRTLSAGGTYTLVVSDNGLNQEGLYSLNLLKVPASLPTGLYNPFPPDTSAVVPEEGFFRWSPIEGATYDLYLSDDPLVPPELAATGLAEPLAPLPALEPEDVFRWRVVAHAPSGDIEGPEWWFSGASGPVAWQDQFTDGTRTGGDPDWIDLWMPARRTWSVVGKARRFASSSAYDNRALYKHVPEFLTGELATDLWLTTNYLSAGPNATIIFSYLGGRKYRYVKVKPDRIVLGQKGLVGEEPKGIKKKKRRAFLPGVKHNLRLALHSDGLVEVFLDGAAEPLLSYPFKRPVPGWVGFGAFGARSLFDNFSLSEETVLP